jgi:hypothetical protein
MLSLVGVFCKYSIIHGDFHPGNILLKETKQSVIKYDIVGIGEIVVPTYGIRTWIMNFENTSIGKRDTSYDNIMTFNNFYFDVTKFFNLLGYFIKGLDLRTLVPIQTILNKRLMDSTIFTLAQLEETLNAIDGIAFL